MWIKIIVGVAVTAAVVGGVTWKRTEERKVLGAQTTAVLTNDAQTKIAGEISRLEGLLATYPTYPPLLSQLAKLYRLAGNEEKAVEYEKELVRLGAEVR